jgi:hypothetical protein
MQLAGWNTEQEQVVLVSLAVGNGDKGSILLGGMKGNMGDGLILEVAIQCLG